MNPIIVEAIAVELVEERLSRARARRRLPRRRRRFLRRERRGVAGAPVPAAP